MKIVCIICTDVLNVKANISVCTCGHLFHEECLDRWFNTGKNGNPTCPQCRAKQSKRDVIKRLYFNEQDIACSQTADLSEVTPENFENLQNIIQELKNNLLEMRQTLADKSKFIEEKEAKLNALEKSSSTTKKTLSENQILLDYLKKELENYGHLKKQYDGRESFIRELEAKLREYKSIEMIYKEHEGTFASEMNKYLEPAHGKLANDVNHYKMIVRQLVSTNVLLKENADKQMEEKRLMRKKLITSESNKAEREKKLKSLEAEVASLTDQNDILREENKRTVTEFENWRRKAQTLLAKRANNSILQQSMGTPTLNKENLVVNDTIQISDAENTFNTSAGGDTRNTSGNVSNNALNEKVDESDLKLLEDLDDSANNKKSTQSQSQSQMDPEDEDIIEMRCMSMFAREDNAIDLDMDSPVSKRRKNPFVSYDLNDQDSNSIPVYQEKPKQKLLTKFKSFNDEALTLSQRFKDSPGEVKIVKPMFANNIKRPRPLKESLEASIMSPQPVKKVEAQKAPVNAFSYLSDGFGGRTKVLNKNDKMKPLGGIKLTKTKTSNLTKSKFSK